MPQRTIKFRIRQDGFVEETVEGVNGLYCHQLTEKIESALGKIEHSELTTEAYIIQNAQSQSIPAKIA